MTSEGTNGGTNGEHKWGRGTLRQNNVPRPHLFSICSVLVNCGLFIWLFTPAGSEMLERIVAA